MENKRLKVSWSILNAWAKGDKDGALGMIFGRQIVETPAMAEGKRIHKAIARERLPLLPFMDHTYIFEDIRPDDHVWQNYFRVTLSPWLDLSMVADVISLERGVVIDWKTGKTDVTAQDPMQLYIYSHAIGIDTGATFGIGIIAKVSSDLVLGDYMLVKIGDAQRAMALDYIETYASEIYAELTGNKLALEAKSGK